MSANSNTPAHPETPQASVSDFLSLEIEAERLLQLGSEDLVHESVVLAGAATFGVFRDVARDHNHTVSVEIGEGSRYDIALSVVSAPNAIPEITDYTDTDFALARRALTKLKQSCDLNRGGVIEHRVLSLLSAIAMDENPSKSHYLGRIDVDDIKNLAQRSIQIDSRNIFLGQHRITFEDDRPGIHNLQIVKQQALGNRSMGRAVGSLFILPPRLAIRYETYDDGSVTHYQSSAVDHRRALWKEPQVYGTGPMTAEQIHYETENMIHELIRSDLQVRPDKAPVRGLHKILADVRSDRESKPPDQPLDGTTNGE